jgi:multidrug efflux pump subunit AcrB
MTITLATVYAPIGLQGGLTGSLFREFALTLAGAVTISGVVALTLSPMMSARLLSKGHEAKGLSGLVNRTFDELLPGETAELRRLITPDDLLIFAAAVGAIAMDFGVANWADLMPYSMAAFFLFGLVLVLVGLVAFEVFAVLNIRAPTVIVPMPPLMNSC